MVNITYVPSLKWKQGEKLALKHLSPGSRSSIKPLINLVPDYFLKPKDFSNDYDGVLFFDLHSDCPALLTDESIVKAFQMINDTTKKAPARCTPVVKSNYSSVVLRDISCAVHSYNNGVGIRVSGEDFRHAKEICGRFSNELKVPIEQIDVILDLGQIGDPLLPFADQFADNIATNCFISQARSTTFLSGSFPISISGNIIRQNEIGQIRRLEKDLFEKIYVKVPDIVFADYGCDDPILPPDGPVKVIPTIRYTSHDCWHIFRGFVNPVNKADYEQFHVLSQKVMAQPFYCGSDFCWGDEEIDKCAKKICTGSDHCNHGNLTSWVQRNLNHHIAFVASECASRT